MESLCRDPGAPPVLRAETAAVLAAFPDDRAVVACFLEQDDESLAKQLEAIAAAQRIFRRASQCSELSEPTRFAAKATDRHFPQGWEIGTAPAPRQWVAFYLLRDVLRGGQEIEDVDLQGVRQLLDVV